MLFCRDLSHPLKSVIRKVVVEEWNKLIYLLLQMPEWQFSNDVRFLQIRLYIDQNQVGLAKSNYNLGKITRITCHFI